MPSAPSRSEVENLHRLMMQASADASQLDRRLTEEQKNDGLSSELRHWHDAADAIHSAFERARTDLLRDGTGKDHLDRIRDRLIELRSRARRFDLEGDLDGCVQHWNALGQELAQVSGRHRDGLVRLLQSRKGRVDQTTAVLSAALRSDGMLPERYARVRALQQQHDQARTKYQELRQKYLQAEQDHHAGERQKQQAAAARERQEKKAPLPNLAGAAKNGPVLVRLPDAKAAAATAKQKLPAAVPAVKPGALQSLPPPPKKPDLPKPSSTSARSPDEQKKQLEAKKAAEKKKFEEKKKADEKKQEAKDKKDPKHAKDPRPGKDPKHAEDAKHGKDDKHKTSVLKPGMPGYGKKDEPGQQAKSGLPGQHAPRTPSNRPPTLIRPGFVPPSHVAQKAVRGTPRISVERVERVTGYPTGLDGIGRGGQSAAIWFRADHLPESLSIQGTTSIQLGCSTRLDVMPSVQLMSATAGAPLRGKVQLLLVSSGGHLGTISPQNALAAAKEAAGKASREVAARLGIIGKQVESQIRDVLEDAADKIFRRAQAKAVPNRLPVRPAGPQQKGPSAEHHVARFNHLLGSMLPAAKAAGGGTQKLLKQLDRDHHHRDSVASRLEQTLSHLATASHRSLTDQVGGELRGHLARMDAILARLRGKTGAELAAGAQEIGDLLQRMGSVAAGKGGGAHIAEFKKLVDERRGQLHKLGAEARKKASAEAVRHRGPLQQMPAAHVLGEKQIAALKKQFPGIEKLIRNASHSQLAAELGKLEKSALGTLMSKAPKTHGGLGSSALGGMVQALGGAHLGGFGGGHRGGLGALTHGGGLGKVLEKQLEHQLKRTKPQDIGKLLATFHKAPKGSPLLDLAKKAEAKQKALTTKNAGKKGHHAATAQGLLEVFQEHPKGKSFAAHLAPGGALRSLCESAQRGTGLPIGQVAQHYLASRGHSQVFNAVSTFNNLIKEGHKPHRWGLGSIGHFVSSHVSSAVHAVSDTVNKVTTGISNVASTVRSGISSMAGRAMDLGRGAVNTVRSVVNRGVGAVKGTVKRVGSAVSHAARSVGHSVSNAAHHAYDTASNYAHKAYNTASSYAHKAYDYGSSAVHHASSFISSKAHGLWNATKKAGHSVWGGIKSAGHGLSHLAKSGMQAVQSGASWVQHKAGAAAEWAKNKGGEAFDWVKAKATGAAHWMGEKVHSGLEWAKKVGVAGGGMLKKGVSFIKKAAEYTPLGLAIKAGKWAANGGLQKVWKGTKNLAGKAWGGLKTAYKATSGFLQSPAGQLLVTGLSLAANFIPGGMLVKGLVGAGIGAISAISEGKDWKGILAGAAGGALTGALPFLKLGPLAKVGVGALSGGITALAQGGNLKDALKGAAGGAMDSFDPGAFKALSKLKSVTAAEKLLKGKNLSAAEKEFMAASKFAGPLRGLEKAMANPKARKMVGGLEKAGSKAVKGSIWVSGKAAKVQGVLDKVVGAGDKVHGVLEQVHSLAPGLAGILGDNPAGHFVGKLGDWAGEGDDKLQRALEYGHSASDQLTRYRGYLDKGLGYAGVKDPARAYEKMTARKDLREGRKGGLQHVAKLKLEDHKRKHPELHLAEATGKRTRGTHADPKTARRRPEPKSHSGEHRHAKPDHHDEPAKHRRRQPHDPHADHGRRNKPQTKLEAALARGRSLIKQGQQVAQGVHGGLGKVQGVVEKGLAGAQKVQSGLEQASALARQGAGILGEDSDLGKYLLEVSNKADQAHGYLEQGIGIAEEFNKGVGKAHDLTGRIPGVHDEEEGAESESHEGKGRKPRGRKPAGALEQAQHLEGGKKPHRMGGSPADWSPSARKKWSQEHGGKDPVKEFEKQHKVHDLKPGGHDKPMPAPQSHETEEQKSARLKHAWDKLSYVSSSVQGFEARYAKTQAKIQQMLAKGQGNAASIELMGLGSECDEISKAIQEAKTLSKGHDGYTKEAAFYEDWHKKTKAKLHAAIADTKGLGGQVAISGFGISESTHPDIFENTKNIYAVRTKVQAFGDALHDVDAAEHVKKLLAEAKKAKSDLTALKSKYRKDKAAYDFLTGGGTQDKLIDDALAKLEGAGKGESRKKPAGKADDKKKIDPGKHKPEELSKKVEGGLKAIDGYRRKAAKAGKKIDATLGKMESALTKGLKTGRKVDSGLEKIAGVADQISKALGEDSELGHFAHQVGEVTGKSHEKLHEALNGAQQGKKGLHKGRELFEQGLQLAHGHHAEKLEKVHGKKKANAENEHGGGSHAELVSHAGAKHRQHGLVPKELEHLAKDGKAVVDDAGHIWKDGKKFVHDGKKLVHDTQHAAHDAETMWKDGKKFYKDGKKSVHDVEKGAKDLKSGAHHAKDLWGHLRHGDFSGVLSDGKHLLKDGKTLFKDGKTLVKDGKKLFGEGKHLLEEGKHLFGEGKHLWGEAKGLFGEGKHLVKDVKHAAADGKHVVEDVSHLIHKGKEWVHGNLHNLDLSKVWDQAKKAAHILPEWLKNIFGSGKESPHDPKKRHGKHHGKHHHRKHHGPHPEPAPHHDAGGFSEADIAQVVHGAMQWVTGFGKAVTAAVKDIEKLMSAGKTKEAGDRVQAVSMTSEQTRFEVTRAVSTSAKYPALHKEAQAASRHYLEIRKHFFTFVKGLHGLGGQTQELEGVDGKKYPDLLALSTDLNSLQVKVDALGQLKEADTPMQGPVADLKKEAAALRSRAVKAKSKYAKDPAAAQIVEGLSARLQGIERALGAHSGKGNISQGDKDLGLPGGNKPRPPRPAPHHRKKRKKKHDPIDDILHGGDVHVHPGGGARGDMDVDDPQDIDPAAADTWIGSGEGAKRFSEVFGAFLPAEAHVVHHHAGGVKRHGSEGGIGFEASGSAHGSIGAGGLVHAQGGIGGVIKGKLGAGGIDLSGKGHAGGAVDIGGLHLAGGASAHGSGHIGLDGIHLAGGLDLGINVAGHRFGAHIGGKLDVSGKKIKSVLDKLKNKASGFFKGLFDHLHGFADRIAGWSKLGASLLGKGMHFAEMGMHGLSAIEKASEKVQGMAGKAEGFLNKMGLGKLAGFAGKIGGAAGFVDKEAKLLHGGLKTADKWMGKGKKLAGTVGKDANRAAGIFDQAEHGRFGSLLNLFKASKFGDGIDGRLSPEKAALGSQFDEPRRLDLSTMSRMENFLGGSFGGVRIHTGPGAAQVTNRFAAEAVTVKDHIFFAPGRFNPNTTEGQRLLAHELTHVMQKGRPNLDVRTAESEALHSEHSFGYGNPQMETLNLSRPSADFKLADGEGLGSSSGVHTAKRNRSKGHEAGGKDVMPDGEEMIEQISTRVYELLMEELEQSFESR